MTARRLHLFLAVICVSIQWGCSSGTIRGLQTADVPVSALVHAADHLLLYPERFPMQVAIYELMADKSVIAIEHPLEEMGIPFFVTRDLDTALRHKLVILYPEVDGKSFDGVQIAKLAAFVKQGGTLFGPNVLAGGLKELFGFTSVVPSQRRYALRFEDAHTDPILKYLRLPEEQQVQLADPKYGDVFWTNGYASSQDAQVLAKFADGTAAVVRRRLGKGSAYLVGISFADAVLRNQINRDYDAQRHYVNAFEPGTDVWLLILRGWYEAFEADAVRLGTIPGGQDSALLLSHDIDWENSFAPALQYAAMESRHGVRSTFFAQTKYISDYNGMAFFNAKNIAILEALRKQGFSIASHSVIHSRAFNKAELGRGDETYRTYRAQGTGNESATGMTTFEEVRVSKELLNGGIPGQDTLFFRAGHLRISPALPEVLQRTGYLFDSSFTADDVLTHFPFALPLNLGFEEDSGIYEFPVTFEDEELPSLLERVEPALNVIRATASMGGISVLLIHPNDAGTKLLAEQEIIERLPSTVKAMDLLAFAEFWRGRCGLHWTATSEKPGGKMTIAIRAEYPVSGATFFLRRKIERAENAQVLPGNHAIVLPALAAHQELQIRIHYASVN